MFKKYTLRLKNGRLEKNYTNIVSNATLKPVRIVEPILSSFCTLPIRINLPFSFL